MSGGELILYTAEDGSAAIQLRAEGGTVWLTQAEIATLFDTTPQNITQHVRAIYSEGELTEDATCKADLQVRSEAPPPLLDPQHELAPARLRVLAQRGDRRRVLARRKRALQARHGRRLRTHEFGNLGLRQAGLLARFEQLVEQSAFLALDAFDFLAHAGAPHQPGDDLFMGSHA